MGAFSGFFGDFYIMGRIRDFGLMRVVRWRVRLFLGCGVGSGDAE